MKKTFFALLGAGLLLASCSELQSLGKQLGSSLDAETRTAMISAIVGDALSYATADSTNYLVGTWVCQDNEGSVDSIIFRADGTWRERTITKEMNCAEEGTYVYYRSNKVLTRKANRLYNYKTNSFIQWENSYADQVSKMKASLIGLNQLSLTSYDLATGNITTDVTTFTGVQ